MIDPLRHIGPPWQPVLRYALPRSALLRSALLRCCLGSLCCLGCLPTQRVLAADVYRSRLPGGEERFSSQPLDASYQLYLRDESPPAPNRPFPLRKPNAAAQALKPLVASLAQKHGVDVALVQAMIEVESRFNPQALSRKGAAGLMQLMPDTAKRYGVTNRYDNTQNLEAGIRHLKDLLRLHQGNVVLALSAYNAGAGAISKHGQRIPPYRETMLYVPAVLAQIQAIEASKP